MTLRKVGTIRASCETIHYDLTANNKRFVTFGLIGNSKTPEIEIKKYEAILLELGCTTICTKQKWGYQLKVSLNKETNGTEQ